MNKRVIVIVAVVAVALGGAAVAARWFGNPEKAAARAQQPPVRAVPVETAQAVKKTVPVRLEALGTVTPMASVAIKSRIETVIVEVHFTDGAEVAAGDLLFTLDSRAIAAQIKQVEGTLASAKAQLEQAQRDVERYTELVARNASTQVTLNNANTQLNVWSAAVASNTAQIENLRVQLSYCTIRAPIPGRISMAAVKLGNLVRPADTAALATINQMKPIYVVFGLPQRSLADVRRAIDSEAGEVRAMAPGNARPSEGRLAMIDNSVDVTTGMFTVRASMDNKDEALWPGTLVNVALTLRNEESVTVPSVAVQSGQSGPFVFVVKNGAAAVQPVKVDRVQDGEAVVVEGLSGDESVVTDGQLLLADGTRVAPRRRAAGT
jgi:RND family efflux transporter MFP subunit